MAVRRHTDAGRKQAGDAVGLSSSDEKSGRRILVNGPGKIDNMHSQAQVR